MGTVQQVGKGILVVFVGLSDVFVAVWTDWDVCYTWVLITMMDGVYLYLKCNPFSKDSDVILIIKILIN